MRQGRGQGDRRKRHRGAACEALTAGPQSELRGARLAPEAAATEPQAAMTFALTSARIRCALDVGTDSARAGLTLITNEGSACSSRLSLFSATANSAWKRSSPPATSRASP